MAELALVAKNEPLFFAPTNKISLNPPLSSSNPGSKERWWKRDNFVMRSNSSGVDLWIKENSPGQDVVMAYFRAYGQTKSRPIGPEEEKRLWEGLKKKGWDVENIQIESEREYQQRVSISYFP